MRRARALAECEHLARASDVGGGERSVRFEHVHLGGRVHDDVDARDKRIVLVELEPEVRLGDVARNARDTLVKPVRRDIVVGASRQQPSLLAERAQARGRRRRGRDRR